MAKIGENILTKRDLRCIFNIYFTFYCFVFYWIGMIFIYIGNYLPIRFLILFLSFIQSLMIWIYIKNKMVMSLVYFILA